MNNYLIIILLIGLISCDSLPEKKGSEEVVPSLAEESHASSQESINGALGRAIAGIDYKNRVTLKDDSRVHQIHKTRLPKFCENYVLWRVKHDGSCWVSAAIAQFIFQAIDAGPAEFDRIIREMKALHAASGDRENAKEFFEFLALMREKLNHAQVLALYNHENVYRALIRGFRALLASNFREFGNEKEAARIEKPNEWGLAETFYGLFNKLGLKFAGIRTDGELGKSDATRVELWLDDYFPHLNRLDPFTDADRLLGQTLLPRPKILFFRTSPGFMDVAVLKEISDQIQATTP